MCCGFNPSSCHSYFLFSPTDYGGCWEQPGGQVLWTRRRDLGNGELGFGVSPSSVSTGWPLFRRSSLKRSFRSRSWMTASFVPWISSSEAILAVLLAFFGNPLRNESRRGTVNTSPSRTSSTTKAQCSKMPFTAYLFRTRKSFIWREPRKMLSGVREAPAETSTWRRFRYPRGIFSGKVSATDGMPVFQF